MIEVGSFYTGLLVRSKVFNEILHESRLNDADLSDKASCSANGVCTSRETKEVELIAMLVVVDNEVVCFNDVFCETNSKPS